MFDALKALAHNRTTYRIGLLQAKAYRMLKYETAELLAPFGVSTTEWAFLGLLYDTDGMNPSMAAEELGVEAPFVTAMTRALKQGSLIEEVKDQADSRKKWLCLTAKGKDFVVSTEKHMRESMKPLIDDVTPGALASYLFVLQQIITNVQKKL